MTLQESGFYSFCSFLTACPKKFPPVLRIFFLLLVPVFTDNFRAGRLLDDRADVKTGLAACLVNSSLSFTFLVNF